ncbi:MAG TPA: alpha/beta hydrolase [Ktedonobacteraceae bacterium]|nr:alpha/beta hydrolase [Ktedonobacteraceae bacterium]
MPTVKVNAIQMYYEIHGKRKPLLLIGGLGLDLSEVQSISGWLAQRYQVIVFANRGAGRTEKPDVPYSLEAMADDTAQLMKALTIEGASLLGISMGAKIALALALRYRGRVEKLIVISTSARVINSRKRLWRFRLLSLVSNLPLFQSKHPQPRYAFLRQLQASGSYNCVARLHELHVPTSILHGKRDRTAPYALAQEMHAGIQGSRLLPFQGGHLFFLFGERQPFLDAIAAFMEGNDEDI